LNFETCFFGSDTFNQIRQVSPQMQPNRQEVRNDENAVCPFCEKLFDSPWQVRLAAIQK